MDSTGSASTGARRANVYLEATETAATEAREIRAEIAALEDLIVTRRGREALLNALLETMRGLLPSQPSDPIHGPVAYVPVEIIDAAGAKLDTRQWDTQPIGASNGRS